MFHKGCYCHLVVLTVEHFLFALQQEEDEMEEKEDDADESVAVVSGARKNSCKQSRS